MKNALVYVFVGIVGIGIGMMVRGAPQSTPSTVTEQVKSQAIQEAMTAVEGPVVHTFSNDEQMRAFAQRWQQRQALLIRLAMLEGYWNNEQTTLNTINERIANEYKLDTSKNYMLDAERKVIVERPGAPGDDAVPPTPATPAAGEVIAYTFTDDGAVQSFAQLWQQRQSSIVRMAVLKAYWDAEKQSLSDSDQEFIRDYGMDMAKQYSLDEQRRVLMERQAPTPGSPAAGQTPGAAPQATPAAPAQR